MLHHKKEFFGSSLRSVYAQNSGEIEPISEVEVYLVVRKSLICTSVVLISGLMITFEKCSDILERR